MLGSNTGAATQVLPLQHRHQWQLLQPPSLLNTVLGCLHVPTRKLMRPCAVTMPMCRALYDYQQTQPDDLTINSREMLYFLIERDDGWAQVRGVDGGCLVGTSMEAVVSALGCVSIACPCFVMRVCLQGMNLHGQVGFFPSAYVEPFSPENPATYTKVAPQQLSFLSCIVNLYRASSQGRTCTVSVSTTQQLGMSLTGQRPVLIDMVPPSSAVTPSCLFSLYL